VRGDGFAGGAGEEPAQRRVGGVVEQAGGVFGGVRAG